MGDPTLSERLYDFHVRRVDRWSHKDQGTVGQAIWALRKLEAILDAYEACDLFTDGPEWKILLHLLEEDKNAHRST